jgi:hypothetical protein
MKTHGSVACDKVAIKGIIYHLPGGIVVDRSPRIIQLLFSLEADTVRPPVACRWESTRKNR